MALPGAWGCRGALLGACAAGASLLLGLALRSPAAPELPLSGKVAAPRAERAYGELPLAFEPGGRRAGSDFIARAAGLGVALSPTGATLALARPATEDSASANAAPHSPPEGLALRVALPGADPAHPEALRGLPGEVNYLAGNEPARWRTDVPTYGRVRYPGAWPGIDVVWYGTQAGRLEYDFRLAPGAHPERIAIAFRGQDQLRVARNGDLVLAGPTGPAVRQRAPRAYQVIAGERRAVESSYAIRGNGEVGISVGRYERSRPLVIDPVVLAYSTFLGGSRTEEGRAIAVDSAGAAYLIGSTESVDFPTTAGALDTSRSRNADVFVAKLNPAGSALSYSTFLGGSGADHGYGIAVDPAGAAYLTGYTDSPRFPTTAGALETSHNGGEDVFVAKLSPAGSALSYSAFLGGSRDEAGYGIAVDSAGAAYLTGATISTDFPTTAGAFDTSWNGYNDVFVAKFNPAGSALSYSTVLGASETEVGAGIAVDSAGAAYLTGHTYLSDFPTTAGAFDTSYNGGIIDAFAAKLNPAGSALSYSTFLGGGELDAGMEIAVDSAGAAYLTGYTFASNFPTTAGAFDTSFNGGEFDAVAVKLDPAGSALSYSTFLGGSSSEEAGYGIAVDSTGAAYLTGYTYSSNFPTTAGAFDTSYNGARDAFAAKLNPGGSALSFSTFLGGPDTDTGRGIAVDSAGDAYLIGNADLSGFPTTAGAFDTDFGGNTDAFAAKLAPDADGDGIPDASDNCPLDETGWTSTPATDNDADGCRDATEDADDDNDTVNDGDDNCPLDANPEQENLDGDIHGDACDPDDDDDGVDDSTDSCDRVPAATASGCPLGSGSLTLASSASRELFKGSLSSDTATCEPDRVVKVWRRQKGDDTKIGQAVTNDAGKYKLEKRPASGRYYATTSMKVVAEAVKCAGSKSPDETVR